MSPVPSTDHSRPVWLPHCCLTHPAFLHLHFYPGNSFVLFSITFRKHIQASPGSVDIFQTPPKHSPDSLSPGPHLQVWITFAWSMPPSPCCQEPCGLSPLGLDTYWPSPSLAGGLPPGLPKPDQFSTIQFSSVTQSCPTLCNPMNHSTPGLSVHHRFLEFTQTHVHWVGDAI